MSNILQNMPYDLKINNQGIFGEKAVILYNANNKIMCFPSMNILDSTGEGTRCMLPFDDPNFDIDDRGTFEVKFGNFIYSRENRYSCDDSQIKKIQTADFLYLIAMPNSDYPNSIQVYLIPKEKRILDLSNRENCNWELWRPSYGDKQRKAWLLKKDRLGKPILHINDPLIIKQLEDLSVKNSQDDTIKNKKVA
jgi:hypothetical protein